MEQAAESLKGKKVLVVRLSALGDVVQTLPAVERLAAAGATVDWLTQPAYAALARCCPLVRRVLEFPRRHFFRRAAACARALRQEHYDLALDLQGLLKSALGARAARADRVLGPSYEREGARRLYDAVLGRRDKNRHAVDEMREVVFALGVPPGPARFPLELPVFTADTPRPRIALAPCSRWATKDWPVGYFACVGRALTDLTPGHIHLIGGPEDRAALSALEADIGRPGRVANHAGETTLPQLGGQLRAMDLLITVDSGPMHLAAALGVPTIALFGPTDPRRTGPYGPRAQALQAAETLDCRPCFARACRRRDHACLRGLRPDVVLRAAMERLTGAAATPP